MEKVGVKFTAAIIKSLFSITEYMTSEKASLFNHLVDFTSNAFLELSLSLISKPYSLHDHKMITSKANKQKNPSKTHHHGTLFLFFQDKT